MLSVGSFNYLEVSSGAVCRYREWSSPTLEKRVTGENATLYQKEEEIMDRRELLPLISEGNGAISLDPYRGKLEGEICIGLFQQIENLSLVKEINTNFPL